MPITQETLLTLLRESRAAHTYGRGLRDKLLEYFSQAAARYPNNKELGEVLQGISYLVRNEAPPDDRETWRLEHHYRRHRARNDSLRKRQEIARRMAGIPTHEEALAILNGRNEMKRLGVPAEPPAASREAYAEFNRGPKPSKPGIIFPRDYPDDKPLEFDIPTDGNNSSPSLQIGLDIPADPYDNGLPTTSEGD